mgnify:CR=1 FL=1
MRQLKKLAYAAFGLLALTGCEGGELYDVNAPDWISDKIQEIEDSKKDPQEEEELEGMLEDVYTIGNTDYTSGFWQAFSKYYVVPDGQKWNGVFNLHINPGDNTYYKNFALILTNDVDRGGDGYKEYGAIRFDLAEGKNSQWGDYIDAQYMSSTMPLSPEGDKEEDPNVQKLGGKVTLTIDRTNAEAFTVKMTNGTVTKTYQQPYQLENLNADASNTQIRCFLVPEGSYIEFLQTNIEPIGGLTSAADKNPVSMVLAGVPEEVNAGSKLEDVVKDITAEVTFEEGVKKTVKAEELQFSAIPDIAEPGEKALVAVYNKTFKGENCATPIMANAKLTVVEKIISIEVTSQPTNKDYYFYTSKATESVKDRTLAFDPTGMVITAKQSSGTTRVLDNSKLTYSVIPAKAGEQTVTITAEKGITATVKVNVAKSQVTEVNNSTNKIGKDDNTDGFKGFFSDYFKVNKGETKSIKFTNFCNQDTNWNNFIVSLCKQDKQTEYAFVRADNWGAGTGYDACTHNGTQGDWATWLQTMNNSKVTVYVTNCGNGTADVQVIMVGNNNTTSTQYYLGINKIDVNDLYFAMTGEKCHLVF